MREKIENLRKELNKANHAYFVLEQPVIDDNQYDLMLRELKNLEQLHPEYDDENSPTKRVGSVVIDSFEKVPHQTPMLSLDNIFSLDEFLAFDQKIVDELKTRDFTYVCEVKIDGLAMSLRYDPDLKIAATRGDGKIGENVTHNIRTIRSLPLTISQGDLEVRGEVYISKANFEFINQHSTKKYANPRNLASGSVRQLDSSIASSRNLDMFAYGLVNPEKYNHETYYQSMLYIQELGFKINTEIALCNDPQAVIAYIEKVTSNRHELDYEIDGIVIKVNEYKYQQQLGFTSKYPKWATAFKFASSVAITKLEDIFLTVGRTGKITPNAQLTPVALMGSTLSRATLHNFEYIQSKDIRVGDTVEIIKAGDIIPRVERVLTEERNSDSVKYILETHCPRCQQQLEIINQDQYCVNPYCSAKEVERLIYFVSKDSMNIEGLGSGVIEHLYEAKLVKNYLDLYNLDSAQLMQLEKMGERSVSKLQQSITASLNTSLSRFITALGIKGVGPEIARVICSKYPSIDALRHGTIEEITSIPGVGPIIATNVYEYFQNEENNKLIDGLIALGLNLEVAEVAIVESVYTDKSVVITGSFQDYSRSDIKKIFESLGAAVKGSVSANTDFVIAGEKAGSKLTRAHELEIEIIDEQQLVAIINGLE